MLKYSDQLIKIAKQLAVIGDQDNNNINILCQRYSLYPCYITIKLSENKYRLIKTLNPPKTSYSNQFQQLCFSIIRAQGNYSNQLKQKLFEWQKIVNIQQLKKQLIYGQFNLDAVTFQQLYGNCMENFQYRNFTVYILSDKFHQVEVKKFIDQIYKIVPNELLKKYGRNIQFKQKLDNNHIAQVNNGILEITEYNVHAFIHQIGHQIYSNLNNTILTVICDDFHKSNNNFPSNLSRQNLNEYFAQLFAFYYLDKNKLNSQQINLIQQYILNKRTRKAKIKLWRIGKQHPYYDEIINSKRQKISNKLTKFIKNS